MSIEHADQLQDMLERDGREKWPLVQEAAAQRQIIEWRAFRESQADVLKVLCGWDSSEYRDREYIVDPLAERIADAFADMIFGGDTTFEAPERVETDENGRERALPGADQELLDDLVDENDLDSELQDAAARCVAEGEVWWRLYVDRDAFEHPVIEWHSRSDVVPLFRGKKVLAAAFVADLSNLAPDAPVARVGDDADPSGTAMWRVEQKTTSGDPVVWRYVEIQTGGLTRNLLFRGERDKLGERRPLTEHEQTADLDDQWVHGLEVRSRTGEPIDLMLAGRFTNGRRSGRLGRSQYAGIKALLYELNKVAAAGSRNVDLTLHKRAVIGEQFTEPHTSSDDDEGAPRGRARARIPETFIAVGDEMGDGTTQMRVLEFSDSWAESTIAWDGHLVDKALTRARVAPQLVGRHTEDAVTGPALRARLMDSILAANGKGRVWDGGLPKLLQATQLVDALPEEQGGCGHDWQAPEEPPTVSRTSVLPEDPTDEATRHVAMVAGEIESKRTAIEELHPVWDDERVDEELDRIKGDAPEPPSGSVFGGNGAVRVERPAVQLPDESVVPGQQPGAPPPAPES
jgi:hypothetical protein